jgi:hypothetical protein
LPAERAAPVLARIDRGGVQRLPTRFHVRGTNVQDELTFRVVLEAPPAGVDYGVQSGQGAAYETVQRQRSDGKDLRFEFTVALKTSKPAAPDFRGPVVQGPRGQRFVYIGIGTYAGQTDTPWSRRLKVPLTGITLDAIDRAAASQMILETRIPGTARDGGPTCATVKPFARWTLAR